MYATVGQEGNNTMNTIIMILGALLIAMGILMHGNRAGWFLFIVTPRTVLWLAAAIVAGVVVLSHARASTGDQMASQHFPLSLALQL